MLPMPQHSATLETLLRVIRELRRGYDRSAADVGLTLSRARVLTTLAGMEGATQAELAHALGIEPPTLKRQVEALERDGFLERRAIEGDARKRALFLSEKAHSAAITRFVRAVRTELFEGVDEADLPRVHAALERIAANAARLNRS
nr:MarR family transcriptional regulator [Cereibacter sphaeroides f. sp. denitrificans]